MQLQPPSLYKHQHVWKKLIIQTRWLSKALFSVVPTGNIPCYIKLSSVIAGSLKNVQSWNPRSVTIFDPFFQAKIGKKQQKTDFLGRFFRLFLAVPTGISPAVRNIFAY